MIAKPCMRRVRIISKSDSFSRSVSVEVGSPRISSRALFRRSAWRMANDLAVDGSHILDPLLKVDLDGEPFQQTRGAGADVLMVHRGKQPRTGVFLAEEDVLRPVQIAHKFRVLLHH